MTDQDKRKAGEQHTADEDEHREECLDEALEETFPASDPVAPQVPPKRDSKDT